MLCVLYFTCILFVFLINVVTLCECHSEIKGYLLTYLNSVVAIKRQYSIKSVICYDKYKIAGQSHLREQTKHHAN